MKVVKYIVNGLIWAIFGLLMALYVLLHIPAIQGFIGNKAAVILGEKLGTRVIIDKVDLSSWGNIILKDFTLFDQNGDTLLTASHLSAGVDIYPLTKGRVSISSAQLFDMDARLYKKDDKHPANFQFVIDSLASKDTTSTPLDIKIASVIIRRGKLRYDQLDKERTPNVFNTSHLDISNLNAYLMAPRITDDEITVMMKRLSATEASGLVVDNISFRLDANNKQASIKNLKIDMPKSSLSAEIITADYDMKDGNIITHSLLYNCSIDDTHITPSDLAPILPVLKHFKEPVNITANVSGTGSGITVHQLTTTTDGARADVFGYLNFEKDWNVQIKDFAVSKEFIDFTAKKLREENIVIPEQITKLGTLNVKGNVGETGKLLYANATVLSDAGDATIDFSNSPGHLKTEVKTDGFNVGRILGNGLGRFAGDIKVEGNPNGTMNLGGKVDLSLSDNSTAFDFNIDAHVSGKTLNTLNGDINITNLGITSKNKNYFSEHLDIHAENNKTMHQLHINSDFADISINGIIDFATVPQSLTNYVGRRISTLPGLPELTNDKKNNFTASVVVYNTEILRTLLDIPLTLSEPLNMDMALNDDTSELSLKASIPSFTYDDTNYKDVFVDISTEDSIRLDAQIIRVGDNNRNFKLVADVAATNNEFISSISWDNNHENKDVRFAGTLNSSTEFFKTDDNKDAVHLRVHTSDISIGDTIWTIEPSDVVYRKKYLMVDNFSVKHNDQHINIDGIASENTEDSITVDLHDMNVAYILNLVNFDIVEFSGLASGRVFAKGLLSDINAWADLVVEDFKFENGRLGILEAHADWDNNEQMINIKALANDEVDRRTDINGYVSIAKNYIDLNIEAENTRLEFLKSFCSSFLDKPDISARGRARLFGDLSDVNLTGDLEASGSMYITTTGVTYNFHNAKIYAEPNEIYLINDSVSDIYGNKGIVNGALHHQSLTNLTFDLDIDADKMLCYDFDNYNGASFFGRVFATGRCTIEGREDRINFEINGTPNRNSFIEYNAASPDEIKNSDFIEWRDKEDVIWQMALRRNSPTKEQQNNKIDTATEISLNFIVNINPDFTLRILMDENSGDYIALNGDGVINAKYSNKGSFDMFGNYIVDHGIYKLTIQNVIKKDFQFLQGSTITFGGDPYLAPLNMKAQYTVNGVSLADLQIGNSFSSNNVRVDCMMNITGTPQAPHVDFDFDLPTVNSDAKQMVRSVINSEEELNQQVIYLLAVGRFYAGNRNNNAAEENAQQSQTSLAMSSLLSGTISQQINNVLSSWFNNNNWNFGANISTGNEGWNNAEYEGILSGRMLNNRLLVNGQFGYRDNAKTATTSFIGDFDIRYLLFPNGNLAVRVYNQTNDRYFTKNSLNTQGLGIIIKRDF